MHFLAINPTTGREARRYETISTADAKRALTAADRAHKQWRNTPFDHRGELLRNLASLVRASSDDLARLMAEEMGKPLAAGRAEAEKCAAVCEYYADNGAAFLAADPVDTDATRSYVAFEPIGVVLAIMPWNFPCWQVFRFAAPTLMAGNGALLKHAPNVPGCALRIEAMFREAGFPAGLFVNLFIDVKQTGALIRHRLVRAVTLTGSVRAGKAVARQAGANIKKTVLELGGSDPYVVLADADLEAAATACVTSRLINAGQSCIAAKRFIVVDAVREEFEALVVARMRAVRMGDPLDPSTEVGPQARADLRDTVHRQVTESVKAGAGCLLGGTMPDGPGFFYPPTVLTNVAKGMAAYSEEVFGPVAAIIPVKNARQAVRAANATAFGLGAAVFTDDIATGERMAREELQAGACFVNTFVRSDPRLPFGGIRESGYGRELGRAGILEFVNVKTVYIGRGRP
ncbi:MAG TPA: NAD-dependent succinate-semialdehyde dehydrogenase [Gemmatimonadales bacterium]